MPPSTLIAPVATPIRERLLSKVLPSPYLLAGGVLFFAWLELWNKLRIDWTVNDQYAYGWTVPPIALVLLALRWEKRPAAAPAPQSPGWAVALVTLFCLLLLGPIRLVEEPNPDWRLLYWAHAGLLCVISLAFCLWSGGWPWVRYFAFPIGFLLLAVPWPSGPEQAIVQSLMRVVAEISADGMNILGIPAVAQGNLIHVRDQTLGVDEACSGIRSLQTMIMGALLAGEVSRLSWPRRFAVLGVGIVIAMIANVFRSSLLVWITAHYEAATMERFHDSAGVSVLLIVAAGLVGVNSWLARGNRLKIHAASVHQSTTGSVAGKPRLIPLGFLAVAALCLVVTEGGVAAWYGVLAPRRDLLPRWTINPPTDAPGFQTSKIDSRTSQMLRFDQGISARWVQPGPSKEECVLFFFRWEPGHASAAQADMHQPHICLTASGLTQIADWGIQPLQLPDGITLPVRRYEFGLRGQSIYVFFVVWQDGVGARNLAEAPGTRWSRLQPVLEHRANTGRQTLEFIVAGSTNAARADECFRHEVATMVHPILGTGSIAAR